MFRIANDVKGLGKHASMVHTQLEQVAKSGVGLLISDVMPIYMIITVNTL